MKTIDFQHMKEHMENIKKGGKYFDNENVDGNGEVVPCKAYNCTSVKGNTNG